MLIQNDSDADIRLGDVTEIEVGTTELNSVDRYNQDRWSSWECIPGGTSEIVVGNALYSVVENKRIAPARSRPVRPV